MSEGTGIHVAPDMDIKDALKHYGVKGMKWGKTKVKPTTDEIKTARGAIAEKKWALEKQGNKMKRAGKNTREAERAKYEEMKMDFLKDPDRVTASRLTTGQKVVGGVLAYSGVATVPILAYAGGRKAANLTIAKRQREGYYDR